MKMYDLAALYILMENTVASRETSLCFECSVKGLILNIFIDVFTKYYRNAHSLSSFMAMLKRVRNTPIFLFTQKGFVTSYSTIAAYISDVFDKR